MKALTDEDLDALLTCPKVVLDPPRREMRVEGRMKRNDFTLKTVDGQHTFRVFLRQSDEFQENCSIGLIYQPNEEPGAFQLMRCNGQHGGERAHPHHAVFHIHRASAADLAAGILEPREIKETKDYASFREALAHFCRMVRIERPDDHFPGITQTRLFRDDETQL